MAAPMDIELYGIFFLLILFALLGCGLAYTCICGYTFFRKRVVRNGFCRDTPRRPGECQPRNTHTHCNTSSGGPSSAVPRSTNDPPLQTVPSIPSWNGQSSWPIQRQSFTTSAQNFNSGTHSSAVQTSFNTDPQSGPLVNTTRHLLHANEHPFNQQYYFPNEFNSSDLPPTYEEAIKDKTTADVPILT